jgi:hypothetical protein
LFPRQHRAALPRLPGWRAFVLATVLLLCLLGAAQADARELKIATWNLNWLTGRADGDPALPPDVHPRSAEDFAKLREYAANLDADVIAIQEVDGAEVASRLFPREAYSIHMTHDPVVQRVGIVVRRGLSYDVNPDLQSLADAGTHLRSGADITLHLPQGALRILAVHLKTGCHDGPLSGHAHGACLELHDQLRPLREWIAAPPRGLRVPHPGRLQPAHG